MKRLLPPKWSPMVSSYAVANGSRSRSVRVRGTNRRCRTGTPAMILEGFGSGARGIRLGSLSIAWQVMQTNLQGPLTFSWRCWQARQSWSPRAIASSDPYEPPHRVELYGVPSCWRIELDPERATGLTSASMSWTRTEHTL